MSERDDLIKRAQRWGQRADPECVTVAGQLIDEFIAALSNQWIPVSERLPESSDALSIKQAIVYVPDLDRITFGWHFDGDWHIEHSPSIWNVSHWQPLPAPPED